MKKIIDSDKLFESTTVPLIDLVNSAHKFKVPEFQRDYDWKTGEKEKAEAIFRELNDRANEEINQGNEDSRIRLDLAACYAAEGDKEKALYLLQEAIDLGFRQHHYLELDPAFEDLFNDPEFNSMMSKLEKNLEKQQFVWRNLSILDRRNCRSSLSCQTN